MSLAQHAPVAFIPTNNAEAARKFYEETLSLRFISDDQFAMVFRIGPADGIMLRVGRSPKFEPLPFTIFGWEAPDIETTIAELTAKGVEFLRFGFFEQDQHGIWTAPDGTKVAWFKDPDGNILSLSKHS